jgi:hypothetical protein
VFGEETGMGIIVVTDPDACKPLPPLLVLFVAVSFSFHMLTLSVMRNGTELLLRLCTAGAVPVGWVALVLYDIYFGPHVDPALPTTQLTVSWYSQLAMLLVVAGIMLHRTVEEPSTDFVLTSPFEERDRPDHRAGRGAPPQATS